jgi:hypothetical protein
MGGAVFYEDVSNLSLPITISGTPFTTNTANGTQLFNTHFYRDVSGRILNIQAGGYGSGFTCFQNSNFNANSNCQCNNCYGPPYL